MSFAKIEDGFGVPEPDSLIEFWPNTSLTLGERRKVRGSFSNNFFCSHDCDGRWSPRQISAWLYLPVCV